MADESQGAEPEVTKGEGYAVATDLDALGQGPGFRTVRRALDVTAFGVNVIVIPAGYDTGFHYHDEQQELYFLHSGEIEMAFGDGTTHRLSPGGTARVDAHVHRSVRNVGEVDAVYLCAGGKDGYVGRDGRTPGDEA